MTDHDKDKHLDELLDSALAAYSDVEPRPGLETRLIAQVREAARPVESPWRNSRWLWAAGAVAAAAVLLVVLFARKDSVVPAPGDKLVQKKPPAGQPNPVTRRATAPSSPEVAGALPSNPGLSGAQERQRRGQPRREAVASKVEPRQPVFPTPTPLSEQEKLLLSYYAQTPREELIAQGHPEEPPIPVDDQSNTAVPELILVPQKSSNTR